ncbi:sugar ABC transporter substrate-binding protein [Nitratireductor aquimarinus]|uniref:Sugar ABC transporter substrate-binding protein n=1 Tax=Nitratireductor aquimarinus TaxID=889300 RepID=A0ABU4APU6_9HYPH|nr:MULTISPECIES: sugar ABC transporter substrate-binding protein [Nitratireductor]MBN7778446.1 sugar ABC transporter substrate-binding protein [Nitratireductor pacificus]MBN7782768.1 sugar ABC transporter substrate-binding protein [Nitratireductor pacificus]MBN7791575.1 sugar ABC transporter substrate-binding protein [Nitratireductor aquimarinus]MBY6100833.1 sugar ABC transporter substrate-binding protein [Nitratireductor aquimarinus]MCA1260193.1 sugar ABC transporter substrate-binding protein
MKRTALRTAVAGAALLAAMGWAHAETVRVTVAEYSSKTGPYFEEAAKAFEEANPGSEIQVEVVPWDVLLQKLTTDISGGANADLSIIGTRWLIDFVDQGIAAPLDDYMTQDFKDRFFPVFLEPSVMQEKTYGLPVAASARAMYYNKDLFEQAGITEVPDTWDELAEAARKIGALGDDIAGFGLQGKEIETDVYFYYAFWAYGGELVEEDGTSGLDTDAGYKAAEMYKSLIDSGATQPGVTSYNREDVQNLFKQGKVGMMITAPFLSNQIKEEAPDLKYGVAAIPAGPEGDRGTYGVTDSIIMFENSENKDLAWKFLDQLFTTEWRAKFTSGEGFLPVNPEVAAQPAFADNADLKEFTALLPDARFAPVIAGWEEIAATTSDAVQTIYLGNGEAKATLDAAAGEINSILGN